MRLSILVFIAGMLTNVLICQPATADLVLGLQFDDASTSMTVNSGDTVFVDLLLTDTDASTPLTAEGLLSGGGRLMRSAGTIGLTAGVISDVDNWWANGVFDTNPASAGGLNEIAKVSGLTDLFLGPAAGLGLTTVRIARFAIQASGAGGDVATITADILGGGFDAITTFDTFAGLDGVVTSFGSVDLTISGAAAVPEPATMLLGSVTAAIAGGAAWKRRRKVTSDNRLVT